MAAATATASAMSWDASQLSAAAMAYLRNQSFIGLCMERRSEIKSPDWRSTRNKTKQHKVRKKSVIQRRGSELLFRVFHGFLVWCIDFRHSENRAQRQQIVAHPTTHAPPLRGLISEVFWAIRISRCICVCLSLCIRSLPLCIRTWRQKRGGLHSRSRSRSARDLRLSARPHAADWRLPSATVAAPSALPRNWGAPFNTRPEFLVTLTVHLCALTCLVLEAPILYRFSHCTPSTHHVSQFLNFFLV
jgi:hypothetical protein